jgi:hypothetical protein
MVEVAELIHRALSGEDASAVRTEVRALAARHDVP